MSSGKIYEMFIRSDVDKIFNQFPCFAIVEFNDVN